MSVTVNVVGQTAVSVSVAASTSVSVIASGGIGPAGFITVPGTSTSAFGTFQLQAGDGITVSTANGQFLISSYPSTSVSSLAPVQSVAGRTGTIVLQASDVTAGTFAIGRIPTIGYTALSGVPVEFVSASHTHDAAAISSGTLSIARVPTISYTALSNTPASFTPSAHTHSTSDVVSFTAAAAAAAPVQSVSGRTGAVTLAKGDVGLGSVDNTADASKPVSTAQAAADAAVQAHAIQRANHTGTQPASSISDFAVEAAKFGPVTSVAGRTGAVSLATADVAGLASVASSGSYTSLQNVPATFAPSAHTHSTADITGITGAFAAASHTHDAAAITSGVLELARIPTIGYTALSGVPTSFSPSVHTHSTADVVGLTASFSQLGHMHSTADITGYSSLPAQAGKAGPLVTDGTAATWATRYSVVDPVLVQGSGMTLTRDTSAGSITVAFAGGTSGIVVSSATPQPLGTASAGSSSDASRADHVHLMPSAADVGAAATGHSHPYVQVLNGLTGTLTIAGGSGVTVSTASSSITIAAGSSYTLPTASAGTLGGIKVGSNLTIADGVLAATGGGISWSSVPASVTATATAGEIAYDGTNGFFYVASATNSWRRFRPDPWDQYRSSTSLILPFDGTMTDFSPTPKTVTVNGSASALGAAKFGSYALSLGAAYTGSSTTVDGSFQNTTNTGDWLDISDATAFVFGSSDLTVECWYYPIQRGRYSKIVGPTGASADYPFAIYHGLDVNSGNPQAAFGPSTSAWFTNASAISFGAVADNQWVHLAVVRQGDTFRTYRNGVQQATGTTDSAGQSLGSISALRIGRSGDFYNKCLIDDFRVTKGVCRYPSGTTFTPPTVALPID
jgi:hypothetical protein